MSGKDEGLLNRVDLDPWKMTLLRVRIQHCTVYTYRNPVVFGQHRLVLRPREGHDLRVESFEIDITPAHRLVWARDVHNNSVAIVDFLESASRLEVRSTVIVQRSSFIPRQAPPEAWSTSLPVVYHSMEIPIVAVFQSVSYPDDLDVVRSWLQQFPEIMQAVDAEAMLSALCTLIAAKIQYQPRYDKGVQTPEQTLRLCSGSCRDLATLMMEAVRAMGLSARFASGYLDCPASEAGRAAMHAWTEVYLPITGWCGFDPTLGEPVSHKHIVVGVSHHPRGVMPISGVFTGSGTDSIEMVAEVKVERIEN